MANAKTQTNYTTKVALFALHVLTHGEVQPSSDLRNDNEFHIRWSGQDIIVQRSVNTEFHKPHYEYTLRTLTRVKLYSIPMDDNIQEKGLHGSLYNKFHNGLSESVRKTKALEMNKISNFQGLEEEYYIKNNL